jgi:hypothetical protein
VVVQDGAAVVAVAAVEPFDSPSESTEVTTKWYVVKGFSPIASKAGDERPVAIRFEVEGVNPAATLA